MSVYTLPPDLPAPVDDGACDHLAGLAVPELTLDSSQGPIDLAELGATRAVLYVYPVFPPDRNAEEVLAWLGS